MAENAKEKLLQAQVFIKEKKYAEAQSILQGINHPKAHEWLAKIEKILPIKPPSTASNITGTPAVQPTGRGTELSSYGVDKVEVARRAIVTIILIIVFGGITIQSLPIEFSFDFETVMMILLMVIFILAIIYLIVSIVRALREKRNTKIYTNGIERNGNFTAWQEIDGIKGNFTIQRVMLIPVFVYGSYVLDCKSESILEITPIDDNAHKQYQQINQALIRTHLDRLVSTVNAGDTVEFEKMHLKADGLHYEDKHLPMDEIGEVTFQEHQIHIVQNDGKVWKFFVVEQFYNPYVFQALVHTIIRSL